MSASDCPRLRRARGERRRRRARRWPRRSTRSPRSRAYGCAASRACTRLPRSASPTSPISATRSSRSTSRPARTRRSARPRSSRRSRASSATSGAGVGGAGVRASSTSTCSSSAEPGSRSTGRPRPARSRPRPIRRRRRGCSRSRIGTPASGCSCSRRWPTSRRDSFRRAGARRSRRAGASVPPSKVPTRSGRSRGGTRTVAGGSGSAEAPGPGIAPPVIAPVMLRSRHRRCPTEITRMTKIGYAAMLEQFHPTDLLDWCAQAEDAGFEAGFMVSEHFHPWTPQQGQSAFAWSFMGALGTAHERCRSGRRSRARASATTPRSSPTPRRRSGAMYPGPVLARAGRRRGAQRARRRRRTGRRSASAAR